jgi:hypothetical protein
MEKRFGKMADAFLAGRGIITDEASRWKLIEQASLDLSEAAKKLSRNADGDFTPDDYARPFPKLEEQTSKSLPGRSLTALIEAWHEDALDRDVIKRDAARTKQRFEILLNDGQSNSHSS